MSEVTYTSGLQTAVRNLSPAMEISYQVPAHFTQQLVRYISKGLIKVYDKDGNKLKVEFL